MAERNFYPPHTQRAHTLCTSLTLSFCSFCWVECKMVSHNMQVRRRRQKPGLSLSLFLSVLLFPHHDQALFPGPGLRSGGRHYCTVEEKVRPSAIPPSRHLDSIIATRRAALSFTAARPARPLQPHSRQERDPKLRETQQGLLGCRRGRGRREPKREARNGFSRKLGSRPTTYTRTHTREHGAWPISLIFQGKGWESLPSTPITRPPIPNFPPAHAPSPFGK